MLGAKDDMLVFDRCGQLTFHIPLPYSYLGNYFVEAAIKATYYGFDRCNCGKVEEEVQVEEEVIGTTVLSITEFVTETQDPTTIETTEGLDSSAPDVVDRNDALLEKHSEHDKLKLRK